MNQHSSPPGGWSPEPRWMDELRAIDKRIAHNIDVYVRLYRRGWLIWMTGGLAGYWIGFATNELFKWWAGIK